MPLDHREQVDLLQKSGRLPWAKTDLAALVAHLLPEQWHLHCEIIPEYMPPYPGAETRPSVQVRFNGFGSDCAPHLRYSKGPRQGFFWDVYGDDFQSVALAIIALSRAPYPENRGVARGLSRS